MRIKKFLSCLLSAALAFACLPMQFICAEEAEEPMENVKVWDGTSDTSWWDDEERVFHISTPEQLAGLRDLVNTGGRSTIGKIFILDNDIYLNDISDYEQWDTKPPKRTFGSIKTFSGAFYGQNHIIYGLYNNVASSNSFISYVDACASIEQINFSNAYISITNGDKSPYYVGILGLVNSPHIKQISVQGEMILTNLYQGEWHIGGLIGSGRSEKGYMIENCKNMMNINITNYLSNRCRVGGIAGTINGGITHCSNSGNIRVENRSSLTLGYSLFSIAGGIVGEADSSEINSCCNIGDIQILGFPDEGGTGGICGVAGEDCRIRNCYNTGVIGGIGGNGVVWKADKCIPCNVYNVGKCAGYAIAPSHALHAYYLTTSTTKAANSSIAKTEANMKTESFAEALGDAFVYVEGDYPKLAWEVGKETICSRGDVNLDESVDIADVVQLQKALLT